MNEWNIQSRAHTCESCNQPFADKQVYHTLLLEDGEGLKRSDICEPCWKKQEGGESRVRKGFISHWQGAYEAPAVVTQVDPIQKDTAETLLRKLIEQNDPKHAPAAYILAVMLERKRILRVKEQIKREGQRIFVYELAKTGDIFTIADPDLHLDQLQQVQQDVAMLLEHGLNGPAPAPAALPENPAAAEPAPTTQETATEPAQPTVAN